MGGGVSPSARVNVIDYITIGSTGNASDFGDLSAAKTRPGAASSLVRGVFAGGETQSTAVNVIEYVTISSTGNASDFGDLPVAKWYFSGCSNCHGGIS